MKEETHEASCDDWVANPDIPSGPLSFEAGEGGKVGAFVEQLSGTEGGRVGEAHDGREGKRREPGKWKQKKINLYSAKKTECGVRLIED